MAQDKIESRPIIVSSRDCMTSSQTAYCSERNDKGSTVLKTIAGEQNQYKRLTQAEDISGTDEKTPDLEASAPLINPIYTESADKYDDVQVKEQPWYYDGASFSLGTTIIKWFLPFAICFLGNMAMAFMLHVGTYYYVHVMTRFELAYRNDTFDQYHWAKMHPSYPPLSAGVNESSKSYGSLEDPIEGRMGWKKVSLQELDMAALILPCCWFVLVVYQRDLQIWTKTLLCHSMLAFFKGVIAMVTTIPDSIGWHQCKVRLGEKALHIIANDIPDPLSSHTNFFKAVNVIADMELKGYISHKPVRFCADMLYSGHTFVTCLYGFALVELTRKTFIHLPYKYRMVLVYGVSIFFGGEQVFEIHRVLQNRFHYLMDIIVAILMVMLWFTNSAIIVAASRWAKFGENPSVADPVRRGFKHSFRKHILEGINENRLLELIETAQYIPEKNRKRAMEENVAIIDTRLRQNELPVGYQLCAHRLGLGLLPRNHISRRDGDLWIPPACCPFAQFYGGRFSILANNTIERYDPVSQDEYAGIQAQGLALKQK